LNPGPPALKANTLGYRGGGASGGKLLTSNINYWTKFDLTSSY